MTASTIVVNSLCDFLQQKASELKTEKAFKAWLKDDPDFQRLHMPVKWAVAIAFDREAEQADKDQAAKDKRAEKKAATDDQPAPVEESQEEAKEEPTVDDLEVLVLRKQVKTLTTRCMKAEAKLAVIARTYIFSAESFFSPDQEVAEMQADACKDREYAAKLFSTSGVNIKGFYDSKDDIKRAYRILCKKYHPDHGGSNIAMIAIQNAKNILDAMS